MIHTNTLTTYTDLKPELTKRQSEVLKVFEDEGSYTDTQVADILGLEINHITGRIGELLRKEKLFEVGHIYVKGRPRRICQKAKHTLF